MNEINERTAFESHLKQTGRYTDWTKDPDGKYQKPRVQDAWEAWLASATLRGYAELDLEYANRYRFLRATNGRAYVSFNEKPNWKPCGSLLDDAMDWAMEAAATPYHVAGSEGKAAKIIDALNACDWSGVPIGSKVVIQAAIDLLAGKRGTPEQIEFERKLTCEAINGAMAFGYQDSNPPPSEDHWLAPFWKIGHQQAEFDRAARKAEIERGES